LSERLAAAALSKAVLKLAQVVAVNVLPVMAGLVCWAKGVGSVGKVMAQAGVATNNRRDRMSVFIVFSTIFPTDIDNTSSAPLLDHK
jgi:hypothetical protein